MRSEVLVGFSGGIDSCEAVRILKFQGYRVTALTLDMTGDSVFIAQAKAKAEHLGVNFISLDVREEFSQKIIDYFAYEYLRGRTPAPCTLCNTHIKWRFMKEVADAKGIEFLATGHYFGITQHQGNHYVTRPKDRLKDQTYYLWGLSQEILGRIVTPMSSLLKSDLMFEKQGNSMARESMGVCFLRGASYKDFLLHQHGANIEPGDIIDETGRAIGRHAGYPLYTIGQKRGLDIDIAGGCVVDIDSANNRLTLGDDKDLYSHNMAVSSFNVVDINEITSSSDISVMIRGVGRNPDGFCKINIVDDNLIVNLDSPAWALAKGQPVVFYRKERLVGGGILEKYY